MTAYIWIGRKLRHAHAPVGEKRFGEGVDPERIQLVDRDGFNLMDNPNPQGVVYDITCCACGFAICDCERRAKLACPPPPPKDELPEGWSRRDVGYVHVSGAQVIRSSVFHDWYWHGPDGKVDPASAKRTCAEAMAAALEAAKPKTLTLTDRLDLATAVANLDATARREAINLIINGEATRPAEPELRPGWTPCAMHSGAYENERACALVVPDMWSGEKTWTLYTDEYTEKGFDRAWPAMLRAEELAAQRGAR